MSTTTFKNIVLIDDDETNNFLNRQFLRFKLRGSNIHIYEDARLALKLIVEKKINKPDLILLDINMPELNGWQFLDQLKRFKVDSPVMILSSSLHWDDIDKSKEYDQVKTYIIKPLTEEKIDHHLIHQNFDILELD